MESLKNHYRPGSGGRFAAISRMLLLSLTMITGGACRRAITEFPEPESPDGGVENPDQAGSEQMEGGTPDLPDGSVPDLVVTIDGKPIDFTIPADLSTVDFSMQPDRKMDLPDQDMNPGDLVIMQQTDQSMKPGDQSLLGDQAAPMDQAKSVDQAQAPDLQLPYCVDGDKDMYDVCDPSCQKQPNHQCGDCDDKKPNVNPGAMEPVGSLIDLNCDGWKGPSGEVDIQCQPFGQVTPNGQNVHVCAADEMVSVPYNPPGTFNNKALMGKMGLPWRLVTLAKLGTPKYSAVSIKDGNGPQIGMASLSLCPKSLPSPPVGSEVRCYEDTSGNLDGQISVEWNLRP